MKKMQALYGKSALEILRAAADTFEQGPIISRQKARIEKLAAYKSRG